MAAFPQVPGYRIEKELGQGGMARVYLAHEEKLERHVALKVLLPSLAETPHAAERFLKEARTAGKLRHNGIITVYDVDRHNDTYYMAVEYLEGGSLKDRINSGPMAPGQALEIMSKVASALDYAHGKGFIHRDIKPDNILFREDGEPVLTDFGIAKAVDSQTKLTRTGMSIGTPHYMSPEQARGQAVDARSDLYSLGIVLYEMLTGKVPYDAEDSVAIAIKHIQEPVPKLAAGVGAQLAVPSELTSFQSLIEKLLAKDAKTRVQTGAELIKAIDALKGPGLAATPAREANAPESRVVTWKPQKSRSVSTDRKAHAPDKDAIPPAANRKGLVYGLVSVLVVLVAALYFIISGGKKSSPPDQPTTTQGQVEPQPDSPAAETAVVDPGEAEFRQYFDQAKKSYEAGSFDKALRQVELARALKQTSELSALETLIKDEMERVRQASERNYNYYYSEAKNAREHKDFEKALRYLSMAKKIKTSVEVDTLERIVKDDLEQTRKMVPEITVNSISVSGNMVLIKGRSDPFANLFINGISVRIDTEGKFIHTFSYQSIGEKEIVFRAVGPAGGETVLKKHVTIFEE